MGQACAVYTDQDICLRGVLDLSGEGKGGKVEGEETSIWYLREESGEKGGLVEESTFRHTIDEREADRVGRLRRQTLDAVLREDGGGEVCKKRGRGAGEVGPVALPERIGATGEGQDEVGLGQNVERGAAREHVGCEHVPETAVGTVRDGVQEDKLDIVWVEYMLVGVREGGEYDLQGESHGHDFHEAVPKVEVRVFALDKNGGREAASVLIRRDDILLTELDEAVEKVARPGRVPVRWKAIQWLHTSVHLLRREFRQVAV